MNPCLYNLYTSLHLISGRISAILREAERNCMGLFSMTTKKLVIDFFVYRVWSLEFYPRRRARDPLTKFTIYAFLRGDAWDCFPCSPWGDCFLGRASARLTGLFGAPSRTLGELKNSPPLLSELSE